VEFSPRKPIKSNHQDGSASDLDFAGGIESEQDEDEDIGAIDPRELEGPIERSRGGNGSTPPKGMTKSVLSTPRRSKGFNVIPNGSARKTRATTLTLSLPRKVIKRQLSASKRPLTTVERLSGSVKSQSNHKGKAVSSAKVSLSSAEDQSATLSKSSGAAKKPDANRSQRSIAQMQNLNQGNKNIPNESQFTLDIQQKKQEPTQPVFSKTPDAAQSSKRS
jgi:hypothetical protein